MRSIGCGKRTYPTRREAKKAAAQMHLPLRAYKCPGCGYFHLTHLSRRRTK